MNTAICITDQQCEWTVITSTPPHCIIQSTNQQSYARLISDELCCRNSSNLSSSTDFVVCFSVLKLSSSRCVSDSCNRHMMQQQYTSLAGLTSVIDSTKAIFTKICGNCCSVIFSHNPMSAKAALLKIY